MDKCIKSVMNQDFDDFELILVNDGSDDNSYDKALEWVSRYPNQIRAFTQENAGQGDARNKGVVYAEGEYIMFVDSDDSVEPFFISEAYKAITVYEADMAIFDADIVDEDGNYIEDMPGCHCDEGVITLEDFPKLLFEYPCPWNKIYKRELFTLNGLEYPTHMWYEDLVGASEFYAKARKIAVCHKKLYYYMQRSDSVMHSAQTAKNLEILKAVDMIIDYYRSEKIYSKYEKELEYLAIYHILVATAGRTVRADSKSPYPQKLVAYMNDKFPNWKNNKYLSELSKANRLKLKLLDRQWYKLLHLLYKIGK
jgi:glycosyltransferase involved in cell wall biosynthesis